MEFLKKLFDDDDKIVGLCGFKEKDKKIDLRRYIAPQAYNNIFEKTNLVFNTNTKHNFLLS